MSRRYGDGSAYRKGSGWEAAGYINGRRRSVRGRTMREARDKLRELQQRASTDDSIADARLTVAEYLQYWLSVTESTVRPTTYKRYEQYVGVHAIPVIGHLRLTELRPMHLQQLYAAGLRKIRFHDLRHTFATLQLTNNQSVKIVSEMMGHTRTAITQDLCTHVSVTMQRSAADALDRLVAESAPEIDSPSWGG